MAFGFRSRRKRQSAILAQCCVGRHLASFIFLALDELGVVYDLDLPLIIRKAHAAAETLFVQAPQLRLISVVIGRAQKRSAQPAPRHIREISLYRIAFYDIDLVKIALSKSECVSLQKLPIYRDSAAVTKLIKRCFRLCCETNFVTPLFFQKQTGQNKHRIRNRSGLDLRNDIFEYVLARQKPSAYLRRLRRRLRVPIAHVAILGSIGMATPAARCLWHSATVALV